MVMVAGPGCGFAFAPSIQTTTSDRSAPLRPPFCDELHLALHGARERGRAQGQGDEARGAAHGHTSEHEDRKV